MQGEDEGDRIIVCEVRCWVIKYFLESESCSCPVVRATYFSESPRIALPHFILASDSVQ